MGCEEEEEKSKARYWKLCPLKKIIVFIWHSEMENEFVQDLSLFVRRVALSQSHLAEPLNPVAQVYLPHGSFHIS